MNSDRIIDKAELIVDIIMKHLNENHCNHNIREAMKSKFYLTLLAIFGSITISGFYLGENILKVVGLAMTVPVGILSLLSLI